MEKLRWIVYYGVPIIFGISFVINVIIAIAKGGEKYKVRAVIDALLGMLSVFPALFYYDISLMREPSCTSNTPAGLLILIIIIKIYCMVTEKEIVKECEEKSIWKIH